MRRISKLTSYRGTRCEPVEFESPRLIEWLVWSAAFIAFLAFLALVSA